MHSIKKDGKVKAHIEILKKKKIVQYTFPMKKQTKTKTKQTINLKIFKFDSPKSK